jgi:hypothetical protein
MDRKRFTRRGMLKLLSAGGLAAWAGSVFPEFPLAKAAGTSPGLNAASGAMQSFVGLEDSHGGPEGDRRQSWPRRTVQCRPRRLRRRVGPSRDDGAQASER